MHLAWSGACGDTRCLDNDGTCVQECGVQHTAPRPAPPVSLMSHMRTSKAGLFASLTLMLMGWPRAAMSAAGYSTVSRWDRYASPTNRSTVCQRPSVSLYMYLSKRVRMLVWMTTTEAGSEWQDDRVIWW